MLKLQLTVISILFSLTMASCAGLDYGAFNPLPMPTIHDIASMHEYIAEQDWPQERKTSMQQFVDGLSRGQQVSSHGQDVYSNLRFASMERDRRIIVTRDEEKRQHERYAEEERARHQKIEDDKKEAELKHKQYLSDYENIVAPDDAASFISRYEGQYDPGNLTASAKKRGYEVGIKKQKECADYMDRVIDREREIGEKTGFVNATLLHQAGEHAVDCKKTHERYVEEYKKFK